MSRDDSGRFVNAEIPGVYGAFPSVDLFLQSPVGNKTGSLLPTGQVVDTIAGQDVSCIDVAVPIVIAQPVLAKRATKRSRTLKPILYPRRS